MLVVLSGVWPRGGFVWPCPQEISISKMLLDKMDAHKQIYPQSNTALFSRGNTLAWRSCLRAGALLWHCCEHTAFEKLPLSLLPADRKQTSSLPGRNRGNFFELNKNIGYCMHTCIYIWPSDCINTPHAYNEILFSFTHTYTYYI